MICKIKNCNNSSLFKNYGHKGYCCKHYVQIQRYGKINKRTPLDKNEIIDCGKYYEICLYTGRGEQKEIARTKIDKEDLNKIKNYKWGLATIGYTVNGKSGKYLHQLIMGSKKGFEVDHINHDILDNRKQNLRLILHRQNVMHRKNICGVTWDKTRKKWLAKITINKKQIHIGRFDNKIDALIERQKKQQEYFNTI